MADGNLELAICNRQSAIRPSCLPPGLASTDGGREVPGMNSSLRKWLGAVLVLIPLASVSAAEPSRLVINADLGKTTIHRNIYGHFSEHLGRCIYEGYWVGEDSPIPNTRGIRNDVVGALKKIKVPVLRWPGGCFADEYHWMDGIGPRPKRPSIVNVHWGGVTENNHFGTHEFLDLCALLGRTRTFAAISAREPCARCATGWST